MQVLQFAIDFIGKYGLYGFVVFILGIGFLGLIAEKLYWIWRKVFKKDTFVADTTLATQNRLESLSRIDQLHMGRITQLETEVHKFNAHLDREAEEDVRMQKMESEITALKDKLATETNHIFNQLSSLHDKFDTLTKIMLEQGAK